MQMVFYLFLQLKNKSGVTKDIKIDQPKNKFTKEQIDELINKANDFAKQDELEAERIQSRLNLENMAFQQKKIMI